eukprot:8275455-Pyramimonas_sp.AAC.1
MAACVPREGTTWTSAAARAAGPGASSVVGSCRIGATSCKTSGRVETSEPACPRGFSACVLVIGLRGRGAS